MKSKLVKEKLNEYFPGGSKDPKTGYRAPIKRPTIHDKEDITLEDYIHIVDFMERLGVDRAKAIEIVEKNKDEIHQLMYDHATHRAVAMELKELVNESLNEDEYYDHIKNTSPEGSSAEMMDYYMNFQMALIDGTMSKSQGDVLQGVDIDQFMKDIDHEIVSSYYRGDSPKEAARNAWPYWLEYLDEQPDPNAGYIGENLNEGGTYDAFNTAEELEVAFDVLENLIDQVDEGKLHPDVFKFNKHWEQILKDAHYVVGMLINYEANMYDTK